MTWWKSKNDRQKLETEIEQAQEMLTRVEEREPKVDKVHRILAIEVTENHMGDRLKEHFQQSRRRPGHGSL